MTIEQVQKICSQFEEVTEDIKWETHLCFNIGGKMFLITSPDEMPIAASFKASEETFNELTEREGFIPAPYLARHQWVKVDDINRLNSKQWKQYLKESYELVKSKLPKKKTLTTGKQPKKKQA